MLYNPGGCSKISNQWISRTILEFLSPSSPPLGLLNLTRSAEPPWGLELRSRRIASRLRRAGTLAQSGRITCGIYLH
eukprot:6196429-Pleurochrysis_carterae.AAC.1